MAVGRNSRGGEVEIKCRPAPHNWVVLKNSLTMAFLKNEFFKEILHH